MFRGRVRQIHFIGVAGIGMSGLAEILHRLEFAVSGSDVKENEATKHLETLGVKVYKGHHADHIVGADVVVYSSAIAPNNPEMIHARLLHVPVISRGEMLAELMRFKYTVVIAGSHGKTTTTSLAAMVLHHAGFDPTVAVGGRINPIGSNAWVGEGDLFVAEADESDGSFLKLTPTIAVVTNIDPEHLDYYKSHVHIKQAFIDYVNKVPFYGLGVLCWEHPHVREILPSITQRHVTYGLSGEADYWAKHLVFDGVMSSFDAYCRHKWLGRFQVHMPGTHNVLNALGVIAVADELAIPLNVMQAAIASFHGVQRRFTIVGERTVKEREGKVGDVLIVDDYGHHPAEIEATIKAARSAFKRRVVVAFQPHRYTRLASLFFEFVEALAGADVLFITEVYPAGEAPIPGVTGESLAHALCERCSPQLVHYVRDKKQIPHRLMEQITSGDLVIALGAGDINMAVYELDRLLGEQTL
ncbi:UDP-N-acetylmuramate--L-alanine ligase [Pajaroellobacter abortibovis]|uniref:UDP-N-acetylmuramate--L-alanine ligase n=1 Tax=Pajaroellobacter abortibovis TaxID=1882918 RepID=A0A1L6MVY7_9BACT|nr:UDP-N-acetylmuramate--L-alanine ligase [Pajaroellobacter abortibovis]APR99686.1 UDP-N-acetylmuramate--L-alanine ligase [Pajaroellobacter abortibovis]